MLPTFTSDVSISISNAPDRSIARSAVKSSTRILILILAFSLFLFKNNVYSAQKSCPSTQKQVLKFKAYNSIREGLLAARRENYPAWFTT